MLLSSQAEVEVHRVDHSPPVILNSSACDIPITLTPMSQDRLISIPLLLASAGVTVGINNHQESSKGTGTEGSLLQIFNRTDEGTVKPKAVIRGPKTGLVGAQNVQVYPPGGEIIMAVPGGGSGSGAGESHPAFVGVWSIHDSGDVPPRWTIGGPNGMLKNPRGVALDPKHKTVMVSDKHLNGVLTYYFPEIF